MKGYHYTTIENAAIVLNQGLELSPLRSEHFEELALVLEFTEGGVIWLCVEPHFGDSLIGVLMYIATTHCCNRICCLEVEYSIEASVTILASRRDSVIFQLLHTLGAGHCGHNDQIIDLVITPVPPDKIKLTDQWDMNDVINKR